MTMYITYKTTMSYTHRIKADWLVDKACQENHTHENAVLIVKVQILDEFNPIDFKTVKKIVEDEIGKYQFANITDKFGITTTEQFLGIIHTALFRTFYIVNHKDRFVKVHLQETEKYGVEIC